MYYTDDRHQLRVEFDTRNCTIPADEWTRIQGQLTQLGEAVQEFPSAELHVRVIHHPRSVMYHVEVKLKLPGQSLFTGDRDTYLDSAIQRAFQKLLRRVETYKDHANPQAAEVLERRAALDQEIVAPTDADHGALGRAARAGDYRNFRSILSGYEEWLRKRVGRWIQRCPEAEAQLGRGLAIGDVVEEVYLNAFEHYERRPDEIPFRNWLENFIDPSVKLLLRNGDEERETASFARTLREAPLA